MTAALWLLTAGVLGAVAGMWAWALLLAWRDSDLDRWHRG